MITRPCPVCKVGEIRARKPAALAKRACCSRPCALAVAREVMAAKRAAFAPIIEAERERLRETLIEAVHVAANAPFGPGYQDRKSTLREGAIALRRARSLCALEVARKMVEDKL